MRLKYENEWPVLTEYDQDHLARIALPLGGIGTGTVSLGGRGNLRDWEIMNRPAKGFNPGPAFFALYARPTNGPAVTRALEGPLDVSEYEGATGSTAQNHGLPRFRHTRFAAAYPLGQVYLSDPDVPLEVRLQAFNPLIPGDADLSGLPIAILRFVLTNPSSEAVTASICGTVPNFIGMDGSTTHKDWLDNPVPAGAQQNVNDFRGQGLLMRSSGVPPTAEQWGTMALATTATEGISHRTHWRKLSWGDSLLDFWNDFSADGEIEVCPPEPDVDMPVASLAVKQIIPAHSTRMVTFLLAWHFPNRQTWTPVEIPSESCGCAGACASTSDPNRIGNYYATRYRDAWDVVESVLPQLPQLEAGTVQFVQAFCASDLPDVVKEATLFNLSSLRTQTCFRTEDGRLFGFEGCGDKKGCCLGSCTHVWNYEQATAFLFGNLAKTMREVEFAHATHDNGLMSFRVHLPLERAQESHAAAADGQLGCMMKLYREWQLSGDTGFLQSLWPQAKKALAFCWIPGGWDADQDGVMEGTQHNTMDVEYFGPNPQMQAWYLGALRAGEEMARALGDIEFAGRCRNLFTRGSQWTDAHLFNGEYYEHEIRPPRDAEAIAPGLQVGMGTANLEEPELQLGAGCLVDQLAGQFMAHICDLGYLLDRDHVQQTLRNIMKYNFREGFYGHFNPMRSFVLGDESALLMATYPRGNRPRRPFPYHSEAMTGFEYTAAVGMLYEGQIEQALKCITAIRARYDGRKRSPFDEAECGHHYARAMASWAAVLALTGFHYSAITQTMTFKAQAGTFFWANGYAWGTCRQIVTGDDVGVTLRVLHGEVLLRKFVLTCVGEVVLEMPVMLQTGEHIQWNIKNR
ncbi:MAG: hypothetical protein JXA33_19435 [Anaerolineae bacterium]|nr:hypothetical protein [Anaerolineae bacterium]